MRVCVLIANFNYSSTIPRAVESALNQTVKPQTICIVDDCSTDNSWEIISSYCSNNQREEQSAKTPQGDILFKVGSIHDIDIVGIRLPVNSGPSVTRNQGISVTLPSTDVFAMLDADDEMLPNKLEECLKPFEDERVGLVYANYYNINSETGVKILEVKEPYDGIRLQQECIVHSGFLVRSQYLEKVKEDGWYDGKMRVCEDYELEIRLSNVCMFKHVALALTNVLVHPNNSSNSVSKMVWENNWRYIHDKHFRGN